MKTSLANGTCEGVDRPLALVTEHRGAASGRQVAVDVSEIAEWSVNRPQPAGAADNRYPRQRVVPLVTPVPVALGCAIGVGENRVVRVGATDRGRVRCSDAA